MPTKKVSSGKKQKKRVIEGRSPSFAKELPIWRFDKIDRDGPFAFDLSRDDFNHSEILSKIIDYGNMTWQQIDSQTHDYRGKSKHHYLDMGGVSTEAKARIQVKHLTEDSDSIFSFAFQNKLRIIGIRNQAEFHIIWYDPEHQFYPSKK